MASHGEYADGTDRQTDGQTDDRHTVTKRFPLYISGQRIKQLVSLDQLLLRRNQIVLGLFGRNGGWERQFTQW